MMWILEATVIGIISGLFGILYRNMEKGKEMLLNYWFFLVLQEMAFSKWKILRILARPLGYSILSFLVWFTLALYALYFGFPENGQWKTWIFGLLLAEGIQHVIAIVILEKLITGSKNLNPAIWTKEESEDTKRPVVKGFLDTMEEKQKENEQQ